MRRFRSITAAAAATVTICAGMALTTGPASAARPAASTDANDVVTSDGSTYAAPEAGVGGVNSFAGSGRPGGAGGPGGPGGAEGSESGRPVGGNGQESIIGTDSRVRITGTTSFPYRATTLITFNNGSFCTGWMINANTAVTAGHCLSPGGTGTFYNVSGYRVWPGRNGSSAPFGSCTAKRLSSVVGWVNSGDERYDYGAIKLNCNVGNQTGWFGFWWQSASLTGLSTTISGYPGDKPFGTMWRSIDRVRVTQARQVFYQNDTVGGMSGSPVYQSRPSGSSFCVGQCSMAIHAYGLHGGWPHSTNNHGTRITQAVFNNLINWRNAP